MQIFIAYQWPVISGQWPVVSLLIALLTAMYSIKCLLKTIIFARRRFIFGSMASWLVGSLVFGPSVLG